MSFNFYSTQFLPDPVERFEEIFVRIFRTHQEYLSRLQITIDEYQSQTIRKNFRTLSITIYHAVINWSLCSILLLFTLAPNAQNLISVKQIESLLLVERLDLINYWSFTLIVIWEFLCYHETALVFGYRSPLNRFILNFYNQYRISRNRDRYQRKVSDSNSTLENYFHHPIPVVDQKYLIKNFNRYDCIATIVLKTSVYFSIGNYIFVNLKKISSALRSNRFDCNTLMQIIAGDLYFMMVIEYYRFIGGILFYSMQQFFFLIRFLKIRLRAFFKRAQLCLKHFDRFKFNRNRLRVACYELEHRSRYLSLPNWIEIEFNEIVSETILVNLITKNYILLIEIIVKVGLIFLLTFLHYQKHCNVISCVAILLAISIVSLQNFLYRYVTTMPNIKSAFVRNFIGWLSRSCYARWSKMKQSISVKRNRFKHRSNLEHRNSNDVYLELMKRIRINLFIQSASEGKMGLNCGPIFLITSYRHLEMLLMTIVFLLLFIKKVLIFI